MKIAKKQTKKPLQYTILQELTYQALVASVNEYLQNDWLLRGGITNGGGQFYQAMTKEIRNESYI